MDFIFSADGYSDELAAIAYRKYCMEVELHPYLERRSEESFSEWIGDRLREINAIIALDEGKLVGYMLFWLEIGKQNRCTVPTWGYGADSIKILDCLFQQLAVHSVTNGGCFFDISIYSHDTRARELFSLLQFGTMYEKDVRYICPIKCNTAAQIRAIGKDELLTRWQEIWTLLSELIGHLKKSPVFYLGAEFTEEVYKGFFFDEDTSVYIAEDNGRIVGIIEANHENNEIIFPIKPAVNVGEAYVCPEYRGKGIAQALLCCLESDLSDSGTEYDWVEHGTANPTARGFWSKYFDAFSYGMTRTIEL